MHPRVRNVRFQETIYLKKIIDSNPRTPFLRKTPPFRVSQTLEATVHPFLHQPMNRSHPHRQFRPKQADSGLHTRNGTRWYAKKISNGRGVEHELSNDEVLNFLLKLLLFSYF
jgi:hypothetical protein